jgi:hypothetical protein
MHIQHSAFNTHNVGVQDVSKYDTSKSKPVHHLPVYIDIAIYIDRAAGSTFLKKSGVGKYAYFTYSYANTHIYIAQKKEKRGTLG